MTKLAVLTSEPQTAPLCASYTRISRARGPKDDPETTAGVRRQAEQNQALALSKGWRVGDVYQDNDITASGKKERPEFERLLADLESGKYCKLVVWHPDRLLRVRQDHERLMDVCERRGVEIIYVKAPSADYSTATGRMQATILTAITTHELEHNRERIMAKIDQNVREGKPNGGRRPFGFERDRTTPREPLHLCRVIDRQELVIDEQEIIKEMAQRALEGTMLTALARELNERCVPTVHGAEWAPGTLRTILVSGRISGQRDVLGHDEDGRRVSRPTSVSKAIWKPIISPQITEALRKKFYDPARRAGKRLDTSPHPLVGLLYCRCGNRMYSKGAVQSAFGCKKCHNTIVAKYLVEPLYDAVGQKVRAGELEAALQEQPDTRPLLEELAEIEEQDRFLATQWAKKKISATAWTTATAELERQRREAEEKLQAAHSKMGLTYVVNPQDWDNLSDPARRTILSFFLHRIVVHPSRAARGVFDPQRVKIEWKR